VYLRGEIFYIFLTYFFVFLLTSYNLTHFTDYDDYDARKLTKETANVSVIYITRFFIIIFAQSVILYSPTISFVFFILCNLFKFPIKYIKQ